MPHNVGLGFSNEIPTPDRSVADLGQQGVASDIETAIKQPATTAPTAVPAAVPAAAPVAAPVAAPSSGVPPLDFENSPIKSLLRVFANVGAGLQGKELPTDRLKKERFEQDLLAQDKLKFETDIFIKFQTMVDNAPPDKKEAFISLIENKIKDRFPEIGDLLRNTTDSATKIITAKDLGEFGDILLRITNNNTAKALELLPILKDTLTETADARNRVQISGKLRQLIDLAAQGIEEQQIPLTRDEEGNIVLDNLAQIERLNEVIKKGETPNAALNESQLATLRRNPDLLLSVGLTTPEIQEKAALAEAKRIEGAGSATERQGSRLLELRNAQLERKLSPEELNEEGILSASIEGKRFSKVVDEGGRISVVNARGEATPVQTKDGEQMVDIDQVKETRRKASAVSSNQKALTDTYLKTAKDDIDFVKDTRGVNIETGRDSVDDTRLSFMFARTLPGVGKEIAQGDFDKLAAIPNLPERFAQAFANLAKGRTLPDDVRENMKKRIILDRSLRSGFVKDTIDTLQTQAQNTNTPDWEPPGAKLGSEFNPHRTEGFTSKEDFKNNVKVGQWYLDKDQVLKKRAR